MSRYAVGLAIETRKNRSHLIGTQVGGTDLWKGIRTPGQIRDQIQRIDSEVKATADDLANLHIADPSNESITHFLDSAWTPFVTAWSKFAANHSGWLDNIWGSTWDQATDYQKQLLAIRMNARSVGLHLTTSDPIMPSDGSAIGDFLGFVKMVIEVLLALGAGFLLIKFIVAIRGSASAVGRMKVIG